MKYYNNSDLDTVKESYTYTYDKNSNIKSEEIINNYPTNNSDKVDEKRLYEYDNLGRLTNSAIVNNKNNKTSYYNYTYDEVGNMTSKAEILSDTEKNATVYTYNDLDQLVTSTTSNIVSGEQTSNKTYTYDKNGNNIQEVDSIKNITKEMTYDVDNRLDTYTETEGNTTITQNNLYNGNGQRIQKQEGDSTINYFYQGDKVLYTTNGDGDKISHNFIGLEGNTISTIRYNLSGLEYYVYNKDIKGSTSNIVDNNNNAKISYIYSDFGETEEVGDKTFYNEICYTGGIYDESTSLYYLNARYYNPEDARFITQDTYRGEFNEPSTLHLYAYCANNPINYVDPSGHKYNPNEAIKYAKKYWRGYLGANDNYHYYANDCANFISQCIYAGGIKMTNNWWFKRKKIWVTRGNNSYIKNSDSASPSWRLAYNQYEYFKDSKYSSKEIVLDRSNFYYKKTKVHNDKAERKAIDKNGIKKGDILYFDYGGKVAHAAIINSVRYGKIRYAAHSNARYDETLYSYFNKDYKPSHEKYKVHILRMKS